MSTAMTPTALCARWVHLEGEVGLAGHSDADVLLHALVDALLGGVSEGDIGTISRRATSGFRVRLRAALSSTLGLVSAFGASTTSTSPSSASARA